MTMTTEQFLSMVESSDHNIQTCLSGAIPYLMRVSDNCPKGGKQHDCH